MTYNLAKIKQNLIDLVQKGLKELYNLENEELYLDFPPNISLGDFSIGFFVLAKKLGKSPAQIAQEVEEKIEINDLIEEAKASGPYLNFKIKSEALFSAIVETFREEKNWLPQTEQKERVMVEYLSPNTNKPLHLGHLRNGALGMAVANVLRAYGNEVIKADLINDRGIHICKSMLAWMKWGNGETPEASGIKGDHFVGKWYVRYAIEAEKNPELESEARELLRKWEQGDSEVRKIWEMMNAWVAKGFQETEERFGLQFDTTLFESQIYQLGKDIIEAGIKKNIFRVDENGNTVFDLSEDRFGLDKDGQPKKVTVIRSDGTSVYATQDLGTTLLKFKEYNLDRAIWVVGSEQNYYFQTIFEILEALGYPWAKNLFHLSYAMVYLPDGKMKSREGKVVDADNLIDEVKNLAAQEIKKRDLENSLTEEEINMRAEVVATGAIKFYLLRVKPTQDIHFDPKESLSFDGFTGPYCQYTYARVQGILRKASELDLENVDFSALGNEEERLIIKSLIEFPDKIKQAAEEYNPLLVVTAIYELAKSVNQFYQKHPVLNQEDENLKKARLVLIRTCAQMIKYGLNLLNIEVLEKM